MQIEHDRICGIRLQNNNDAVINIFCLYLPARGCDDDIATTLDELSAILDNTQMGSHNILCGDLNADLGVRGGPRSSKIPDKRGTILYSFVVKYNLLPANLCMNVQGPLNTHYGPTGSSCIDYVLVPNYLASNIVECLTLNEDVLNTSDHLPVKINIRIGSIPRGCTEGVLVDKIRWDKLDCESMQRRYRIPLEDAVKELTNQTIGVDPSPGLIDSTIDKLIKLIKTQDKQVPRTRFKKNLKSFWCEELNVLKKLKIQAFKKWCEAGRPNDPDNQLYIQIKIAKKNFRRRIKQVSREYDEKKISDAIKNSEVDRTVFWKMLKRERDGPRIKTPSIKNSQGKIVHKLEEILDVWEKHFTSLGTPMESPDFDEDHFKLVTSCVHKWIREKDIDVFCTEDIAISEIEKGLSTLNSGKTPGLDGVTKEHLKFAGENMVILLCRIFNWILKIEYIPVNFRRGVQIPLYKGKNTPIVEVNNYRGITLLSTFNKLFEIVIWKRLEGWWTDSAVLSQLQGACRNGVSGVHSAMLLQETISTLLHQNKKVFVTYLDVSKAFDGVWIDGLFYRLRQIGIGGRTWRLLYKTYIDFKCRARVQGEMSNWYTLKCGIHMASIPCK